MIIKFAVVHLYDVGSGHPEVSITYHTSRISAMDAANEIIDRHPDAECVDDDTSEWSLGDEEGWVRIDEVK